VGMLFNPAVLWTEPLALLATVVVILLVKTVGAWAVLRAFGHSQPEALFLAGSLAQIGEFSFILISMTVDLQVIPAMARDLVVAGAMLSMLVNPVMILIGSRLSARLTARRGQRLRPKQTVQP